MFGERIAELRRRHGLSQQEVANLLGVTRQTVSNWECGQGAPTIDKAMALARTYHMSLDELVDPDFDVDACHATIRRENTSMMNTTYTHPAHVRQ